MLHSTYANRFLQLITAKTKTLSGTGVCYIGFSTAHEPQMDGSTFSEPSPATYPSYKRIQVAITDALQYTDKMGTPSNGVITNTSAFASEQCLETGGWPEFTHFGIFDAKTGGTLIASDVLRDPDGTPDANGLYPQTTMNVEYKQVAVFAKGALQLTLK